MKLQFTATLWRWKGEAPAAWFFVTLPTETGHEVKFLSGTRRGFGSVRVTVTIGKSRWKTSLFPDKKSGSYLLPVKAAIRAAERLVDGDVIKVVLSLDV